MPDPTILPEELTAYGVRTVRLLDVRPTLSRGDDPFSLIMAAVDALDQDEALHLIAPFDPLPLYAVLGGRGYQNYTEKHDDIHHIWFYRIGEKPNSETASSSRKLLEPVSIDVRELEPPQPMAVILEKLHELGDGAQLLVDHHREPVMIYDKLAAMGFQARSKEVSPGHWQVRILPAWVGNDE